MNKLLNIILIFALPGLASADALLNGSVLNPQFDLTLRIQNEVNQTTQFSTQVMNVDAITQATNTSNITSTIESLGNQQNGTTVTNTVNISTNTTATSGDTDIEAFQAVNNSTVSIALVKQ